MQTRNKKTIQIQCVNINIIKNESDKAKLQKWLDIAYFHCYMQDYFRIVN